MIGRYCRVLAAGFLAAVGLLALAVSPALAVERSITITPTTVNLVVKAGSVYQGAFQILNQGQAGYPLKIYATPYHVDGEAYTPEFTQLPGATDVTKWFTFSVTQTIITSGHEINVNYTITVPPGTQPGGYYAVAFAATDLPRNPTGITLNQLVGEIFYIQVAGPVKQKGEIASWQVGFLQRSPLTATLRLENDGLLHYFSNIHITISDIFGQPKYSLTNYEVVLPQTIRRVGLSWNGAPALGFFKVGGTISLLGRTDTLPTRYVLVMSRPVRDGLIGLLVVCLIIGMLRLTRWLSRRSRKTDRP